MKPLSETYKELGISFTLPIEIKDADGNETYLEDSEGYKREYNTDGAMKQTLPNICFIN